MSRNALKVDGFEDFFPSGPHIENHSTADGSHNGPQLILTIAEASRKLNIPQSTLYRHVRAGKFQTTKGKDGKPRIVLPANENHLVSTVDSIGDQLVSTEGYVGSTENHSLMFLTEIVREQAAKLEAATYRNGFLEAQTKVYEEQVKLLPDFQAQAAKVSVQDVKIKELESQLVRITSSWWYRLLGWLGVR